MGRNGSGKSSLLKMIAGSIDPDRGRILGKVYLVAGWLWRHHAEMTAAKVRFVAGLWCGHKGTNRFR